MIRAWANTGDRNHVVALTDTHIVTSGNTNSRRGSRRLIDKWNQTPAHRWENVDHTLLIAQIYELRSNSTHRRITVSTPHVVFTMRGFQRRQRHDAAACIAAAAGLTQTATANGVDHYARPGESTERFDGDADIDTAGAVLQRSTVRSTVWALFSIPAFSMAWQWANDVAHHQSLGTIDAVLTGFAAGFCVIAGFRFLMMRLTFDDDGIVVVNFWRRHEIDWTELHGATATDTQGSRLRRPVVEFEWDRRSASTVTTCLTKARAQRIAMQIATQMDSRAAVRSAVYADELMFSGRPSSTSRQCLHAGSFFPTGRASRNATVQTASPTGETKPTG